MSKSLEDYEVGGGDKSGGARPIRSGEPIPGAEELGSGQLEFREGQGAPSGPIEHIASSPGIMYHYPSAVGSVVSGSDARQEMKGLKLEGKSRYSSQTLVSADGNSITLHQNQRGPSLMEPAEKGAQKKLESQNLQDQELINQLVEAGIPEDKAAALVHGTASILNLSFYEIGVEEARALAEALEGNRVLTKLYLYSNEIGVEGAKVLAKALKGNRVLTKLYLSWNNIGDEGAKALASALEANLTLTELNLSSNKIGVEGAKGLAEALEANLTLTELNLSSNNIGDEGAKALAEALEGNTALTELCLYSNEIGVEGAKGLAEALEGNRVLTKLDLSWNNIGNEGAKALAEALKHNQILTTLGYTLEDDLTREVAGGIDSALKHNQDLVAKLAGFILANLLNFAQAKPLQGAGDELEQLKFFVRADKTLLSKCLLTQALESSLHGCEDALPILQKVEYYIKAHLFQINGLSDAMTINIPPELQALIGDYLGFKYILFDNLYIGEAEEVAAASVLQGEGGLQAEEPGAVMAGEAVAEQAGYDCAIL